MTKERPPPVRTPRGWAISVLQEAGAIRECEDHGWMQDRANPHARERAIEVGCRDPPARASPEEAVARSAMFWNLLATRARNRLDGGQERYFLRPRRFSTLPRTFPTCLTAFFTADADRRVFFDS